MERIAEIVDVRVLVPIIAFALGVLANAIRAAYRAGKLQSSVLTKEEADRTYARLSEAVVKESNGGRSIVRREELDVALQRANEPVLSRIASIEQRLQTIEASLLSMSLSDRRREYRDEQN